MGRLVVAAAVAAWAFPIAALVNSVVPEPYMVSSFSSILKHAKLVECASSERCFMFIRLQWPTEDGNKKLS